MQGGKVKQRARKRRHRWRAAGWLDINIGIVKGYDDYLMIDSRPPLRAFSTTRTSMAPLLPQEAKRRRATKPVAPFVMRKAQLWASHPLRRQEQASRRPPPPPLWRQIPRLHNAPPNARPSSETRSSPACRRASTATTHEL
jgi:hypothetical protein